MLKQLILENWKSFGHAVLYIDPLTVIIGTNASGKSNAIEALEFLKRTALGKGLEAALAGDITVPPIRGGVFWAAHKPERQFTLKVLIEGRDNQTDYLYSLTVGSIPRVQVNAESLCIIKKDKDDAGCTPTEKLFETEPCTLDSDTIKPIFYDKDQQEDRIENRKEFTRSHSVLSQVIGLSMRIVEAKQIVLRNLSNIFILDPIPTKMRSYSPLSDSLESDASNIAGILAALPKDEQDKIEDIISNYIKDLPEKDIQRVWAEPIGILKSDAMLYCEEIWKPGEVMLIDARPMSDGTLRFIAMITALLIRPKGSQLIIEDVDNGLHPSRLELLVKMLREIGEERQIDILVTTHNPALLDALGLEIVPFVVISHRDSNTGESKLTLLEDIENLPKLMASGTLGRLTTKGAIERSLSGTK